MEKLRKVIPAVLIALSVASLGFGIYFFLNEHPDIVIVASVSTTEDAALISDMVSKNGTMISDMVSQNGTGISDIELQEQEPEPEPEHKEPKPEPESEIEYVENPYKDKFLENSDMVAWIKIPDTQIDHAVMWTPENEDYYLYRNFQKHKDKYGVPILDTDSTMYPASTNLIIHGHNIKNQTFYYLLPYKEKEYRDEHPYISLYGKDYEHRYEIMAVFRSKVYYTTDTCFKYYKFFNAETEEEFNDFYKNVMYLSLYDTGVTASFGDKFLTLSTCSSHTENGRFVVVAKEIEPGDYYLPVEEN